MCITQLKSNPTATQAASWCNQSPNAGVHIEQIKETARGYKAGMLSICNLCLHLGCHNIGTSLRATSLAPAGDLASGSNILDVVLSAMHFNRLNRCNIAASYRTMLVRQWHYRSAAKSRSCLCPELAMLIFQLSSQTLKLKLLANALYRQRKSGVY